MYGIKLKNGIFIQSLSEYQSRGSSAVLKFDTINEAEEYAQNLELHNYTIASVE